MRYTEKIEKKVTGTKIQTRFLFFSLLFFLCSFAFSQDFGLILDNTSRANGSGGKTEFDYSGILVPRFQTFWGGNNEFYISAGMEVRYLDKELYIVPELLRTELSLSFGKGGIKAGRMYYCDPSGRVADGLFDGARLSCNSAAGVFGAGAWYTGFLYKKRAYIAMTAKEREDYNAEFDYADFAKTYFASSRVLAALDWEHSNLFNFLMAKAVVLGQFDLSGENINSQYLVASVALPLNAFLFDAGGCLELIQTNGDFGIAFSADFEAAWTLPGSLQSRLSILARYSSGSSSSFDAFLPITTKSQGFVLKASYSSLTLLSLDYSARLHRTCSIALSSSYFIRNDKTVYESFGADGSLLGNEFFGRLLWSPVSDLHFNFGAGIFLPSMGDIAPNAKSLWRAELNFIMSLY